jgi:hypothetical protein
MEMGLELRCGTDLSPKVPGETETIARDWIKFPTRKGNIAEWAEVPS